MIHRVLMLITAFLLWQSGVKAEDSKLIEIGQLPIEAQVFVKNNFNGIAISYIMQDEEGLFGKEFDVIFTNGNKIEFDRRGNWKQIDFKTGSIPMQLIPHKIILFLEQKHPDLEISEIERDSKGYEVKLSSGLKLKFDKQFQFKKYDD